MDVLVAKRQRGVGLRPLGAGHLEVFRVDGRRVAVAMEGILCPVGGASRRFGHMIHSE